ncbi:unnamed protein product [Ceratitis capitata]|uniref:(Mediterranean fruit fly) hypothetical protein n=1 Tax=Ceratitis capitata TaxID=7213 RepID=A0A811V1U8_CERCA|nr:unnamed protein product [Ceratitis capitata]
MSEDRSLIAKQIANRKYTVLPKKGRSFIWKILREVYKEDGTKLDGIIYCSGCRKILKLIGSQTSNLSRHTCCKMIKNQSHENLPDADKQEAIDAYAKWITEDCHSFSSVEGSGFAKLATFFIKLGAIHGENIEVSDLLVDAMVVNNKVQKLADEKRNLISSEIKNAIEDGGVSSTISIWTDNYVERKFLAVTMHFQKNFEQIDINLGLQSMDIKNTSSENILVNVKKIFAEFGAKDISRVKFVTDKEENGIVKSLENLTRLNSSSHLLKRVLDKSIEDTSELQGTLQACQTLVKYFTNANLQHRLPTLSISSSPSSWNSNYHMIKSIVDNWCNINEVLREIEDMELLTSISIAALTSFIELSRDFEVIYKKMEVFSTPSLCFVLPSIYKIKSMCVPNRSDVLEILALKNYINYNVDQMWINNLSIWHKTALFLFPPALTKQESDFSDAKEFCKSQLKSSKTISAAQLKAEIETLPDWSNPASPAAPSEASSSESSLMEQNSKTAKQDNTFFFSNWLTTSSTGANNATIDEVEKYSKEVVLMTEDFDLMQWWKDNEKHYPLLSRFAMQIHSIPASSAASEEMILKTRNIITKKGNDFGNESLSNILFLHSFKNTNISEA